MGCQSLSADEPSSNSGWKRPSQPVMVTVLDDPQTCYIEILLFVCYEGCQLSLVLFEPRDQSSTGQGPAAGSLPPLLIQTCSYLSVYFGKLEVPECRNTQLQVKVLHSNVTQVKVEKHWHQNILKYQKYSLCRLANFRIIYHMF